MASGFAWFGAMTFTTLGGLIWLGWIAMMTGVPERLARNFSKLEPGFAASFDVIALAIALALTLLWIALLARSERSLHRSTAYWAGGLALLWGLAMTLWLPWIDYGKSYKPVAASLAAAIKRTGIANGACIESRGLGEAQRAVFHYHGGIVTRRLEASPRSRCHLLLVQADARQPGQDRTGPGWRRVWEGNRPRDRERFRLYVRD
jgi:4-amino-4-deoxy-L-arabinose transferase-like glycosyltransferase